MLGGETIDFFCLGETNIFLFAIFLFVYAGGDLLIFSWEDQTYCLKSVIVFFVC